MSGQAAVSSHYVDKEGEVYFAYQNASGDLGGRLNARNFARFTAPGDRVLDFGCGGGWMLKNLPGIERHGVEVNLAAHDQATRNGLHVTATVDEQEGRFDVVTSNHCLEHVPHPVAALATLRAKLKPGGRLVLIVPVDDWRAQTDIAETIDNHLHTWSPRLLANTLREAGFRPERVDVLTHAWPPKRDMLYRTLPNWAFHAVCGLFARVVRRRSLRAVAVRA